MKAYQKVTDYIINLIETSQELPWQKSWVSSCMGNPVNLHSGKEYKGINSFILQASRMHFGYQSKYFATFLQIKEKGGILKKGSKGIPVIFFKILNKEKDGKEVSIPFAQYSTVFSLDLVEGIETGETFGLKQIDFNPIEACEKIISNYSKMPVLKHEGQKAYYSPKHDYINMPLPESFNSNAEYYSTLFHEIGHSTGHMTRLNRESLITPSFFGSHEYSKEELVAEFTSAFLCADAGIEKAVIDNSAGYIKGWLKALKNDSKLLASACSKAQKASDYILNRGSV